MFNSVSATWTLPGLARSRYAIIGCMLRALDETLPAGALGHVKGFLDYRYGKTFFGNTVFSSARAMDSVHLHEEGAYWGGGLEINVALIFFMLDKPTLQASLDNARTALERELNCATVEKQEV